MKFARDVLHLPAIKRVDFNPYTPNLFISALSCSLIGETRTIFLTKGTRIAQIYEVKQLE
jgi:hypothetical protein